MNVESPHGRRGSTARSVLPRVAPAGAALLVAFAWAWSDGRADAIAAARTGAASAERLAATLAASGNAGSEAPGSASGFGAADGGGVLALVEAAATEVAAGAVLVDTGGGGGGGGSAPGEGLSVRFEGIRVEEVLDLLDRLAAASPALRAERVELLPEGDDHGEEWTLLLSLQATPA